MVLSYSAVIATTRIASVDVFMEDENARKAEWAVHLRKILVTRLAINRPSKEFRKRLPWK